jgi:hypothetical protein
MQTLARSVSNNSEEALWSGKQDSIAARGNTGGSHIVVVIEPVDLIPFAASPYRLIPLLNPFSVSLVLYDAGTLY